MADKVYSFEMNGVKQSFADWVSNISPADTPFTSSLKKEQVRNTLFSWQVDHLAAASNTNFHQEGETAVDATPTYTDVKKNWTQIFNKVVRVTGTTNAIDSWGRKQGELAYQMEKKVKSLNRDVEKTFLSAQVGAEQHTTGTGSNAIVVPRKTSGYQNLVAAKGVADADTGAIVNIEGELTEANLFNLTEALYVAGANPRVIMFNPVHASTMSSFVESTGQGQRRVRMFEGVANTLNTYVQTFIDPLGQEFTLVPNRLAPADYIFVYNPDDFTQMVLRAPKRIALDPDGDSIREMIVSECGLRLRNPYAAGLLHVLPGTTNPTFTIVDKTTASATGGDVIPFASLFTITGAADPSDFDFAYTPAGAFTRAGTNFTLKTDIAAGQVKVVATGKTGSAADGMSATATITAAKPKLTGITLTSAVAGWASDAVTVAKGAAAFDVTLAPAPTGADLGTWTVASGDATATGVTVAKKGTNQVTVTPGATGKAGATTVTITSGTVTKTFAVTVTV